MKFVNLYFGRKLKEAIQSAKLTQADFSEKIGVSGTTVSRWLSGVCLPEDERQDRIFKVLGVDEHFFFNTNPTPPITSAQVAEIQKALSKSSTDQISARVSILEQELKKRDQEILNLKAKLKRQGHADVIDMDENDPEFLELMKRIETGTANPRISTEEIETLIEEIFPNFSFEVKEKKGAG